MIPSPLQHQLDQARQAGQTIVLATGVFDLIHQEHINFLRKAKQTGDFLVVGIESDVRVRQIKGQGRPVNSQRLRQANLEHLGLADAVFVLPEQFSRPADHDQLISLIKPNILAVSSHTKHLDKKQRILEKHGGAVKIVHQHNPAISTSKLLAQANASNDDSNYA